MLNNFVLILCYNKDNTVTFDKKYIKILRKNTSDAINNLDLVCNRIFIARDDIIQNQNRHRHHTNTHNSATLHRRKKTHLL